MLSCNNNIDMEFIIAHPEYRWNWNWISGRSCTTMDMVEEYPNEPWELCNFNSEQDLFDPDVYVGSCITKYTLISLHNEDYDRYKKRDDLMSNADMVVQNIYLISIITQYL